MKTAGRLFVEQGTALIFAHLSRPGERPEPEKSAAPTPPRGGWLLIDPCQPGRLLAGRTAMVYI
jgi:hypothetical protein